MKMEEEKKVNAETTEAKETKKTAEPKAKKERRSIKQIFGIYKGEFDKIIWPSREELVKQTLTVIVTSLMIGAIIASMDMVLNLGYGLLGQI
jgi:preprotein translocase subunit SecE